MSEVEPRLSPAQETDLMRKLREREDAEWAAMIRRDLASEKWERDPGNEWG